jgi:hypothetical protein
LGPERASSHRGEPEPEDGTDVALQRGLEDAVLEAHDGLVDEPDDEPLLNVEVRRHVGDRRERVTFENFGGTGVERPLALLAGVDVTALPGFPAHHSGGDEILQHFRVASAESENRIYL